MYCQLLRSELAKRPRSLKSAGEEFLASRVLDVFLILGNWLPVMLLSGPRAREGSLSHERSVTT